MLKRAVLVLGALIVVCVVVILVSTLATEPMARAFEAFQRPLPGGPPGFVGPFGLRELGRMGPFGRHLGGWRGAASAVGSFIFLYLASALVLVVFPKPLRTIRDAFRGGPSQWLRLLMVGVLTALTFLLLTALGFSTSAAFPVPFVLVPFLVAIMWVGLVGLGLALGRGISRLAGLTRSSPVADLALGLLVMFALGRIPVAGWVFTVALAAPALGAVVLSRLGMGGSWSLAAFDESEQESP